MGLGREREGRGGEREGRGGSRVGLTWHVSMVILTSFDHLTV